MAYQIGWGNGQFWLEKQIEIPMFFCGVIAIVRYANQDCPVRQPGLSVTPTSPVRQTLPLQYTSGKKTLKRSHYGYDGYNNNSCTLLITVLIQVGKLQGTATCDSFCYNSFREIFRPRPRWWPL